MEKSLKTEKELKNELYKGVIGVFGNDIVMEKRELVISKINNLPGLEYVEFFDEYIKENFNNLLYSSDLFKKFIIPPFSIFDTKQGVWRERKQILDDYIGSSVAGRKADLAYPSLRIRKNDTGTSQFDSVLTEIVCKWFVPTGGGHIYDCFAGGQTRGVLSSLTGNEYLGIDLSGEQIEANIKRNEELGLEKICWINDDSLNADKYIEDNHTDLLFSCPPYGDLEKYTNDPRDLSNMSYEDFLKTYREIIKKSLGKLKDNRFAVFVVSDFRDGKGAYRGFVADTIKAFTDIYGVKLYNEIILLNSIGTAPMRANSAFMNRKVIRIHQNVLVFFKGDMKTIKYSYAPEIDSSYPIPTMQQTSML